MSHFFTLVLVDSKIDREGAEAAVAPLLAPYDENDEMFREGSRWDWWTIGGRWTGSLSGYEPAEDPANTETCTLCGGSGIRPGGRERFGDDWFESCNGCNGCEGKGVSLKWSTDWASHGGDVRPVAELNGFDTPHAVVTPDGQWHEQARMGWFGLTILDEEGDEDKPEALWKAAVHALLDQNPDAYAVVVDCHV